MVPIAVRWRVGFLLAAAALSCIGDSAGPGRGLFSGGLAVAPVFQSSAAGLVDFDRVRITLARPGGGVARDTVIAIPPTADSVDLSVTVPLSASSETLLLYLRVIDAAGDTVFRNEPYPQSLVVTAGSRADPVETPLIYVGVGADAVAVAIGTPDTLVAFGQSLPLDAVALGSGQQTIPGTPIEWLSLDTARVRVPDRASGQVVGGTQRGPAKIVARLLTGPADTVIVTAQPLPDALLVVSGDSQTAAPGSVLPQPLRVRVTAADGLGVRVPVRFRALTAGATVADSVVASDTLGFAETMATLGAAAGTQTFEAAVGGVAPVAFTAVAGTPIVAAVVFASDSGFGVSSGVFRVDPDGTGLFRLDARAGRGDVHPRWSPDRRRVAFSFVESGPSALYIAAASGDTLATAIADSSARRPRWSPDGVRLAFEYGDGFSTQQDVCVLPDVTGAITSLARLEAQRIFVTDFDAAKPDGPGSFAWDPRDATALVVVRDSADAQRQPLSRLYRVLYDGKTFDTLSAPLVDPASQLPLAVTGPLDWAPDGSVIVFAARDPLAFDQTAPTGRRLYAINRDGTGLTPLTPGPALDSRPVFSPDGKLVLFIRDAGCSVDYWVVNLADRAEQQVSDEGLCDFDDRVLGHDWSPDGRDIVLAGTDGTGNFLIYRLPAGTTAANYLKDRVLIGRGVDAGGFVTDIQPSWRP